MTTTAATRKQIAAIVAEMDRRGLVADGKLVHGWAHAVGLPLPAGVNQCHDDPYTVFRDLSNDGVTAMFRKLSIGG